MLYTYKSSMKELTALDINYLVKEFQVLKDSKIDQIYQPGTELLIRVHSSKFGKKILRISKSFMFLTEFKEEQGQNPKQFCMSLRKHIKNLRLREIEQISFERVVKITLENKDTKLFLYTELFSKGNTILTDDKNKIINSLYKDKIKNIITGQNYEPPIKEFNILDIKESKFKEVMKASEESLVKTLAITFGLGGIYSELVLEEYDKKLKPSELKVKDILIIFKNIKNLLNRDLKPSLMDKRIVPFETKDRIKFDSFNEAIADLLIKDLKEIESTKSIAPYLKKKEKVEKIVKKQTESVKKLKKQIKDNKEKGELIYNNYKIVDDILKQLKEARKNMSWKEIKEKLKGHKIIKTINEKESTIELDL